MKWKINPASNPNIGTTRKIARFAWLPTQVEDHMVWWEDYWSVERFTYDGWEEQTKWLMK
jgi:hypothetical protein